MSRLAPSNRPFARFLARAYWRVRGGNARAHLADVWPGLKLIRAGQEPGAAYWRGRRAATITTGGAAVGWIGETPVIVGSGPSLKTVEIERLGTRQCMLLNGALSLVDKIGSNHIGVIEDERFVWRHSELIATSPVTRWLMSAGVIRTVLTRDASWFERCEVALIDNLEKPFDARRRALDGLEGVIADKWAHFSTRPDLGVVICGTVAFSALQFALAAGPREVALAGIDLTNFDEPRINETKDSRAWTGLDESVPRMLSHFRLAADCAKLGGVRLKTLSQPSRLPEVGFDFHSELNSE